MAKKPESGMYKTKARNLSGAQLKRAGGAKASAKRTVDIGVTKRITTGALKGKTVGAGGKPLTGTVVMANGDRAVYKAGKRVTNVPKKSAAPIRSGGNGSGGGGNGGKEKPSTGNKRTNRLAGERYEAMKGMNRGSDTTTSKSKTPSNLTGFSGNKPGSVAGSRSLGNILFPALVSKGRVSATNKKSNLPAVGDTKVATSGPYKGQRVYFDGKVYRPKR